MKQAYCKFCQTKHKEDIVIITGDFIVNDEAVAVAYICKNCGNAMNFKEYKTFRKEWLGDL